MANNMNGAGNAANNMYGGMNGWMMASAGHYSDMQTLMQNMDRLSGWLQQNREEWAGLQEGLERIEQMQGGGMGVSRRGRIPAPDQSAAVEDDDVERPTIISLSTQLNRANNRISLLESQAREHENLQSLYESTLSDATDRIRHYCFEQQKHTIALHQHYTELLGQSREETIEAQVVHQRWQQAFQKLSENVRAAYKSREEERRPWVGRLKGLREENMVLRRMLGWEPPPPDSDGEEHEDERAAIWMGGVGCSRGRSGEGG